MSKLSGHLMTIALAATVMWPAQAEAWRAWNFLRVNPETQAEFEVIRRGGAGAADLWCAAGDYAMRVLRVPATTRIYLVEGPHTARTERNRIAVSFSLVAPDGTDTSRRFVLRSDAIGDNLSATFAQQYCYNGLGDERRLFP